jgi:hypothetical protein
MKSRDAVMYKLQSTHSWFQAKHCSFYLMGKTLFVFPLLLGLALLGKLENLALIRSLRIEVHHKDHSIDDSDDTFCMGLLEWESLAVFCIYIKNHIHKTKTMTDITGIRFKTKNILFPSLSKTW